MTAPSGSHLLTSLKAFSKGASVAILYYGMARLGLLLAFEKTNASPVWPPSGFAFAAVLLLGYRAWPGILIGAFFANLEGFLTNQVASSSSLGVASGLIATGNTLEAVSGAFLLRRFVGRGNPLDQVRDVFKFAGVALLMCLVSATIGPTSLYLLGIVPREVYGTVWFTWWIGDVGGILVLTPMLLTCWRKPRIRWEPRRLAETALFFAALLAGCQMVFEGGFPVSMIRPYMLTPVLLWAVFRLGPREVTTAVLLVSGYAVWSTAHGSGPFVGKSLNESLLSVQIFIGLITVTAMALVAVLEELEIDIKERKRAEEDRTRLSMAVEQSNDGVMIVTPDATILYVNPAFERITGYSREEVIGQSSTILKSGKHNEAFFERMVDTLRRGEVWSSRITNRRKDGTLYEEEETITPVRDAAGRIINYVAVKRDVTQEVSLEAQLRQAQKMEAIGILAGGIAHDFNNELTGITGFAQLALLEDLSPQARDCIARIPEQGRRAADLISQLLTFSRKAITEKAPMSLLHLIKEAIKILEHTIPENIAIRLNVPREVALVNADPTQMQQVLLNLCINASHAMPDGGELTVVLENVSLDETYCRQYAYARPGDYVCLSVRDTGVGMTPEVQARIFEPFFTTKEPGKGTGLGLAMVYGIVKEHGGHVNVYSEVGRGSEFKVYLPAMEAGTVKPDVAAQESLVRGAETLLLVEDDDMVLMAGQKMLERLGYTVLTATNGEEALYVYRAHQGEIALVLTDMVMPRIGGQELYEALKKMDPAVRVLLVSGYSLKEDVSDLRARGLREFMQKPFDLHKLARAVRQALNE